MPITSSDADQKKLRRLLRELRREAGLRQVDLAMLLDRPQSYVSKIESGERRLDVLELREVCRATGTSLVQFAERLEAALGDREARDT